MGTPVLHSLPLKVCYPLLAAPHTVDSHKFTVKDFLKSLLHTRMLCPSKPVLFPRQSVLWILCLAWPNYPAALFLMAHKLVLEVIFPVPLLLKESEEANKEFGLQNHGTLGNKTKEYPGLYLILQMRKVRPGGQMNSKDTEPASGAAEIRIWASAFPPRVPPTAPDCLQSVSLGLNGRMTRRMCSL